MTRTKISIYSLLLVIIIIFNLCSANKLHLSYNLQHYGIVEISLDSLRESNIVNYKSFGNAYETINRSGDSQLFKIYSSVMLTKKEYGKIERIIKGKKEDRNNQVEFIIDHSYRLSGKVLDEGNTPIPNVSVIIDDTRIGMLTDDEGTFSLGIPKGAKYLLIYPNSEYKSVKYNLRDVAKHEGDDLVFKLKSK
jgi:hypothetical protein